MPSITFFKILSLLRLSLHVCSHMHHVPSSHIRTHAQEPLAAQMTPQEPMSPRKKAINGGTGQGSPGCLEAEPWLLGPAWGWSHHLEGHISGLCWPWGCCEPGHTEQGVREKLNLRIPANCGVGRAHLHLAGGSCPGAKEQRHIKGQEAGAGVGGQEGGEAGGNKARGEQETRSERFAQE